MLILATLLLAQASGSTDNPEDWSCATPLIQKNFDSRFGEQELARRIADECARPYVATVPQSYNTPTQNDIAETLNRSVYLAGKNNFQAEIRSQIQSLRLRKEIPLRH